MKKVLLFILLTLLLVNSGCSAIISQEHYKNQEVQEGDTSVSFECSHGVSSLDPSKEQLAFNGAPIELSYTFQNGEIASNFGLLLFLNGEIQPFQIDNQDIVKIGIVELEPDEEKTLNITFLPVIGQAGETLHLHICAIFDMVSDIESPTIAPFFYHAMSQAIPIDVRMNVDADRGLKNSASTPSLIAKLETAILYDDSENIESKMYMDCQEESSYTLNRTDTIHIINGESIPVTFCLYALVDNNLIPVTFEETNYMTVEPNSEQTINFILSSNEKVFSLAHILSFMGIPLYEETDDYEGTIALKTGTVTINVDS